VVRRPLNNFVSPASVVHRLSILARRPGVKKQISPLISSLVLNGGFFRCAPLCILVHAGRPNRDQPPGIVGQLLCILVHGLTHFSRLCDGWQYARRCAPRRELFLPEPVVHRCAFLRVARGARKQISPLLSSPAFIGGFFRCAWLCILVHGTHIRRAALRRQPEEGGCEGSPNARRTRQPQPWGTLHIFYKDRKSDFSESFPDFPGCVRVSLRLSPDSL